MGTEPFRQLFLDAIGALTFAPGGLGPLMVSPGYTMTGTTVQAQDTVVLGLIVFPGDLALRACERSGDKGHISH
jgi:hypothetical protein